MKILLPTQNKLVIAVEYNLDEFVQPSVRLNYLKGKFPFKGYVQILMSKE